MTSSLESKIKVEIGTRFCGAKMLERFLRMCNHDEKEFTLDLMNSAFHLDAAGRSRLWYETPRGRDCPSITDELQMRTSCLLSHRTRLLQLEILRMQPRTQTHKTVD